MTPLSSEDIGDKYDDMKTMEVFNPTSESSHRETIRIARRKLAVVLPLTILLVGVFPLPLILDTGAPRTL